VSRKTVAYGRIAREACPPPLRLVDLVAIVTERSLARQWPSWAILGAHSEPFSREILELALREAHLQAGMMLSQKRLHAAQPPSPRYAVCPFILLLQSSVYTSVESDDKSCGQRSRRGLFTEAPRKVMFLEVRIPNTTCMAAVRCGGAQEGAKRVWGE
jgi:hypothetical protein